MDGLLPGPAKAECGGIRERCSADGCPAFGRLLPASRDGRRRVRGCDDPVARGGRNRRKGDEKARKARRLLRLVGANTRHEELLGGPVRVESKAGAQVGLIWTRYRDARLQSEAARPLGDHRPFVMTAHPDGAPEFLVLVSSKDWDQVVAAYAAQGIE